MDFEKAKNTYRKNAIIQKQMAESLINILIKKCGKNFDRIFEFGAGTGFLTDCIKNKLDYKEIILNDITDNYTGLKPNKFIKGDVLEAEIPVDSNLIISNAAIQWIKDYKKLFSRLKLSLNKEGVICFSYFGQKNYVQFKEITGIGLDYLNLDDFIKEAGFEILYYEEELATVYFKSIFDILNHIKLTGVKVENKTWTKSDFREFINKYSMKYRDSQGFELTYHPIYYILKNQEM